MGGGVGAVTVDLGRPLPENSSLVSSLTGAPGVAHALPTLLVLGQLSSVAVEDALPTVVELLGTEPDAIWLPTVTQGHLPGPGEILLADKAARDLRVRTGGRVHLRHAVIAPDGAASTAVTEFTVSGIHGSPLRALSFLNQTERPMFGLSGLVNQVRLVPAPGVASVDLQRLAFSQPGVQAARSVQASADQIRDGHRPVPQPAPNHPGHPAGPRAAGGVQRLVDRGGGASPRPRHHVCLRRDAVASGGAPDGRVARAGGTGNRAGPAGRPIVSRRIMQQVVSSTVPDPGSRPSRAGEHIGAAVLGVTAVALAPLLVFRRLRRLDVPATLRVME